MSGKVKWKKFYLPMMAEEGHEEKHATLGGEHAGHIKRAGTDGFDAYDEIGNRIAEGVSTWREACRMVEAHATTPKAERDAAELARLEAMAVSAEERGVSWAAELREKADAFAARMSR